VPLRTRFILHARSSDKYQFGFKVKLSTDKCASVFKQTVDYYMETVAVMYLFACLVDSVNAFVNYWKLFLKLLQDNVDVNIVGLMTFWYAN